LTRAEYYENYSKVQSLVRNAQEKGFLRMGERHRCGDGSCSTDEVHRVFTASEEQRLFGLSLRHAELDRVDFSGANLREAEFHSVSLVAADFSGADLRGASFIGCDLREARFAGALFQLTRFDDSWLIGAHGLSEPTLKYVRLHGGHLWAS
jgi:uncharacterized protein YjbI with pentapeptide repeats